MANACKRKFQVNQIVYVVDYWGTECGTKAFEASAKILQVDEKNKTFDAVLYGDTYQKYSFEDYGRLIFNHPEQAREAASNFPIPQSVVYQKIGKRVYKKTVLGISGYTIDGAYDLVIRLNKGKEVSAKEIGISIFKNESDARR